MQTTKVFEELNEHHRLIARQLSDARDLIEKPDSLTQARLSEGRWRMVRLLRAYQLFKHVEIYDPLLNSGLQERVAAAGHLKIACLILGERFDEYTLRWSNGDVWTDWNSYVAAFEGMADEIELSLEVQLRGIRDILLGLERTRHN